MADTDTGSPGNTPELLGDGPTVVTLSGEIDLAVAPALTERLDALTAGGRPDLVVDLRDVDFIDCTGLGVLCRARNRAVARAGRLRLVSDSPAFHKILRGARLAGVFTVHTGLAEAVAERDPLLTGS